MTAYPSLSLWQVATEGHPAREHVCRRFLKWGFDLDADPDDGTGCWVPPNRRILGGYVVMDLHAVGVGSPLAHRAAWAYANLQPIPDGFQVDHICAERACCRPSHLRAISAVDHSVSTLIKHPYAWMRDEAGVLRCQRGHDLEVDDAIYTRPSGKERECRECSQTARRRFAGDGPVGTRGWDRIDLAPPHPTLGLEVDGQWVPCRAVGGGRRSDGRAGMLRLSGKLRHAPVWVLLRRDGLAEPPLCDEGHQMAADHLCPGAREGCVEVRHLRWLAGRANDGWSKGLTLGARGPRPETLTPDQVAALLDGFGISPAWGMGRAGSVLRAAGHRASSNTITAAQHIRRARQEAQA